jgi:hypothetical protein
MEACHSFGTALMQSTTRIGTQSTMNSNKKNVKEIIAAHPPKNIERERKKIYERNVACGHNYHNAMNEIEIAAPMPKKRRTIDKIAKSPTQPPKAPTGPHSSKVKE